MSYEKLDYNDIDNIIHDCIAYNEEFLFMCNGVVLRKIITIICGYDNVDVLSFQGRIEDNELYVISSLPKQEEIPEYAYTIFIENVIDEDGDYVIFDTKGHAYIPSIVNTKYKDIIDYIENYKELHYYVLNDDKKEIKEGLENLTTFRDMVVDMLQDQDTVNSELDKMNRPTEKDGQYDGIEVTKEELINEALVTINITKCNTCKRNMLEKIFEFGAYCAAAGLVNIDIYKSISKKFFT